MDRSIWNHPVSLEMYGHGKYRIVTSAKEARKVLLNEWPQTGSRYNHQAAVAMCTAALSGEAQPEASREIFLVAASEANIPIFSR
ncbi:DUF982 domain-containing protein [Rhizobium sp. YIM 134829]|uniref:DUF982 domain-containing protein n=1 Tax=Rhizobium sp. YIM 134829 TaxID=3390453 RepID=UPI003977E9F1